MTDMALPAVLSDEALAKESEAAQAKIRGRRYMIIGLRFAVLIIALGLWELAANKKWIDPFFYAQPSTIWAQIVDWVQNGTSQGSL